MTILVSLSYIHFFLATVVAAAVLLAAFFLRRRLATRSLECPHVAPPDATEEHEFYTEYIMPLLVFERDYPSFTAMLAVVLGRFPISRFKPVSEFKAALSHLRDASFHGGDPKQIEALMAVVVQTFLNDPDVEYALRAQLPGLLRQFLKEIHHN